MGYRCIVADLIFKMCKQFEQKSRECCHGNNNPEAPDSHRMLVLPKTHSYMATKFNYFEENISHTHRLVRKYCNSSCLS